MNRQISNRRGIESENIKFVNVDITIQTSTTLPLFSLAFFALLRLHVYMKLPRRLVGKITQKQWNVIRPSRLLPSDRRDIVDVLCAIQPESPSGTKRKILKMAEGLADDLVQGYCEDNTMTPDELRAGQALARAVVKEMRK